MSVEKSVDKFKISVPEAGYFGTGQFCPLNMNLLLFAWIDWACGRGGFRTPSHGRLQEHHAAGDVAREDGNAIHENHR